jgi:predicted ATPase/DNA-binding SARP family transcriptional activator
MVEIRVLGPIELGGATGELPLTADKQRRLLAAFVARVGEACPTDGLIDAVWGASPPSSADKLLQVYVSQLRKPLHPASIRRRGASYVLELNGARVDSCHFERLLREGQAALEAGNPALALSMLRRGLALWRGPAYGEFGYEQFARGEAERLEELRLVALEARFEAELALGRHTDLAPELCALAAEYPLREPLQAQAMLALYRSGRQSEALDIYQALNTRLREELGLVPSIELRDLHRRILQQHPELETAPATHAAHTLAAPPNRLIGRERELKELEALIRSRDVRMLVLTGAGGSGKTRLALEAARNTSSSFANGATVVALAPLRDPAHVLPAISHAIGIPQAGTNFQSVAAGLRPRELLLVLDNAEHLREAGPIFVDLLAQAPRLVLLVTSRVVLHLSGEQIYPVEPLGEESAVGLFLERARQADPRFRPKTADGVTIAQICARLDRLPLAIELAAARVRTLTPVELLRRLEPRLPLLTGGPRDLPARQQTLRATLAWSVDLLQEEERRDLYRLSVFVGGWTLEAAEAVCDTSLERLSWLLDHNLVGRQLSGESMRYSMLETVREFAAEALDRSTDAETTKRRFTEYMISVAESANLAYDSEGEQSYDLATAEQDNARAALAWTIQSGQIELGLELAVGLENFWTTHDPREGARWFDSLLVKGIDLPPRLRMHALRGCGGSLMFSDEERARTLQEEALALARELGDERAALSLLLPLADLALTRGDAEEARRFADETIALNKRVGSPRREAQALGLLAGVARHDGDLDRAAGLLEQSLELTRETGFHWWEMMTLLDLASLERARSRLADAEARALDGLTVAREIGDTIGTTAALANLARLARDRGHLERAGRLWGAVEAADAARPEIEWAIDRQAWEMDVIAGGGPDFDEARRHGRGLSLDEATAYALRSSP